MTFGHELIIDRNPAKSHSGPNGAPKIAKIIEILF